MSNAEKAKNEDFVRIRAQSIYPEVTLKNKVGFTLRGKEDKYGDIYGNTLEKYQTNAYPIINNVEDEKCFARVDYNGSNGLYFIKCSAGHFINPAGMINDAQTKRRNQPFIKFRKVNKTCFFSYLMFLKTGQQVHFNDAMRQLS